MTCNRIYAFLVVFVVIGFDRLYTMTFPVTTLFGYLLCLNRNFRCQFKDMPFHIFLTKRNGMYYLVSDDNVDVVI